MAAKDLKYCLTHCQGWMSIDVSSIKFVVYALHIDNKHILTSYDNYD